MYKGVATWKCGWCTIEDFDSTSCYREWCSKLRRHCNKNDILYPRFDLYRIVDEGLERMKGL